MADSEVENKSGVTTGSLLKYFMNLYKFQLGVPRDTDSAIVAVEPSRQFPKLITYDLQVEHRGEQISRRVTVGPIAEDTGSKSSCFLAIYDSKIVIKIPPNPITDFEEYISCIERDRQIVATLAPRVCLIPGVSMILDKIYKFPRINELRGNQREDAYFEWLHFNQEYQWYLKIDGSFAFFMDLSRHMFLSDILALFHGLETKIPEEVTRDPSILDSFEKFEGRYGFENAHIGVDLKEVYKQYEQQVGRLMTKTSASSSDMLYKMQYWFFCYISGKTLEQDETDLIESHVPGFNALMARIVEENREIIDAYHAMVIAFLRSKRSFQNRRYKEGVVANIVEMLAGVKEKKVAIRDIKPDNLLVTGDMENYPAFLATPERFSIGLIDFETAVVFQTENELEMEQPFLGGTSWYATPLHMYNNKVLRMFYKDIPRSFYLQDWYSVVAMIYRIITGEHLFPRTSKLFSVAAGKLREAKKTGRPAEVVVTEINDMFWKSAVREFELNLERKQEALRFLQAILCDSAQEMLLAELDAENNATDQKIKRLINQQALFKSPENREQLYAITPGQLDHLIKKAEDSSGGATTHPLARSIAQLKQIQKNKVEVQKNRDIMRRLKIGAYDFTVYELLIIMFNRVVSFMHIRPLEKVKNYEPGQ